MAERSPLWPEPPPWLMLEPSRGRLRRGERIWVDVDLRREIEAEIGLVCIVHRATVGTTIDGDVSGRFRIDVQTDANRDWRPLLSGLRREEFRVSPDAPYSYEGEILSFYWGIAVRVGRRVDPVAYVPLHVAP